MWFTTCYPYVLLLIVSIVIQARLGKKKGKVELNEQATRVFKAGA